MTEAKIKYSRQPESFFRETWRQSMCGYTIEQIAGNLSSTIPTVRRTLKRIRTCRIANPNKPNDPTMPLFEAGAKYKIPNFLSWDRYIGVVRQMYHGGQDFGFEPFHQCLTRCSERLTPRKFCIQYLTYNPVQTERYTINFLDFKNSEAFGEERRLHLRCRSCSLGPYQLPVFAIFEPNEYVFLTVMHQFARYRTRGMDSFEIMMLYIEAALFGMTHEIVWKVAADAEFAGLSKEEALTQIDEVFIELTDAVFDQILPGLT